jgi:hypothetical protein
MNNSLQKNNSKDYSKTELITLCTTYSENQESLKRMAVLLFKKRKNYVQIILSIHEKLNSINSLPDWCMSDINDSLARMESFRLAVQYENSPKDFVEKTDELGNTYATIANVSGNKGTAIAKLGPTTVMAIATVMGTTSTGITISTSSDAAATNAALTWLEGGAIASGVGLAASGIALGIPVVGWVIGLGALSGIIAARKIKKEKNGKVESTIEQIRHDNMNLEPKLYHLSELIDRSDRNEKEHLRNSFSWVENVQPRDYQKWDDAQKDELERLINVVSNTVQLINERI